MAKFGDEPWDNDDRDYGTGPPPLIPGLVKTEIEIQKARIDGSNKDVRLWLSKVTVP